MTSKPVQISIDTDLLRRIDEDAEVRERGRSAFIRRAVEVYFDARERHETEESLHRAYGGQADAMLSEVAELIGSQERPEK